MGVFKIGDLIQAPNSGAPFYVDAQDIDLQFIEMAIWWSRQLILLKKTALD